MQAEQTIEQYLGQQYAQALQAYVSSSQNNPELLLNDLSALEAMNKTYLRLRFQQGALSG